MIFEKNRNRIIAGICALFMVLTFMISTFSVSAKTNESRVESSYGLGNITEYGFCFDEVGYLSAEDTKKIAEILNEYGKKCDIQIGALLMEKENNEDTLKYADYVMDNNDWGFAKDTNRALLFVYSPSDTTFGFATESGVIATFNDASLQTIVKSMSSDLKSDNYIKAFETLGQKVYDRYNTVNNKKNNDFMLKMLICVVLGLVAGGATVATMVSGMKTVRYNNSANAYESGQGLILHRKSDYFTHKNLTRTKIQHESSSGTSTHTSSSSGHTHGGIGGKL